MIVVKLMRTDEDCEPSTAFLSFVCPKCGKGIVSFRTIHKCYNCGQHVVSGGLLVKSTVYRLHYHVGKLDEHGIICG